MIQVSRLNGKKFIVNCEMIKFLESTPDTLITLVSDEKLMVREGIEEVIRMTMEYRKRLYQEPPASEASIPKG